MVGLIAYSINGEIYYAPENEPQDCPRATEEELKAHEEKQYIDFLRHIRENECFSIINRGKLWYDKLTEEQHEELDIWYHEWLDVTETKIIPEKPIWLD